MNHTQGQNAADRRRRLLKGALGASSVLTLGYGGAAAAASLGCVAKIREVDGGYPLTQFTYEPTAGANANWQWVAVNVQRYNQYRVNQGGGGGSGPKIGEFDGFVSGGNVRDTAHPETVALNASLANPQPEGYPKQGWVLAYYDDQGGLTGTYPAHTAASDGATPATASCLASIDPTGGGTSGRARFSG